MVHEWRRGEYSISTDKGRLDVAVIHGFLPLSIHCSRLSGLLPAEPQNAAAVLHIEAILFPVLVR